MKRAHTPTVLQLEAAECGAAALCMVLAWHGRWVPLEVLREACGVSRDGSKAANIVKVARTYGFDASGRRREPATLRQLEPPFIVYWNFNHFIVVEGFSRRHVYVNDPAVGPRRLDHEEFSRGFTGVALVFTPTADFKRGGRPPRALPVLLRRLRRSWPAVVFAVLASFALVVPGLAAPAFLRVFVDYVLYQHAARWILWLLAAMLAAAAIQAALTGLREYVLARMEMRMAMASSARYFWHLLRLPMHFYAQRSAGEVASRVALNDKISTLLGGHLTTACLSVVTIGFYGWAMTAFDAPLAGVVAVLALLDMIALKLSSGALRRFNERTLAAMGSLTATTLSGLQCTESIKAMGRESDFFARWSGHQARVVNLEQAQEMTVQRIMIVAALLAALGEVAVLWLGGTRVIDGHLTIGALMAFQILMHSFLDPVSHLVGFSSQLSEVTADVRRLEDVMANPVEASPPPSAEPRTLIGSIALEDVTFGYSRMSPPLITDFTLTVAPGRRIALVGASGSGKSTIARLVCGLYTPWSGTIRIGGVRRDTLTAGELAACVAFVDQDIFLFEGTVRDNLTLWDPTVDDAELQRALEDACLLEPVLQRLGGLGGRIEEGGRNLSGGERQRLEIARALVGRPHVLVLDEATRALDPVVERAIDGRLRSRGCTCLIVAHRLSTIRDCDEIIVLDAGTVAARGTHEEMMALDGPYRALVEAEATP